MSDVTAHRASILHCLRDPSDDRDPIAAGSVEYFEDGLLVVHGREDACASSPARC